jgi:hypothetical protein
MGTDSTGPRRRLPRAPAAGATLALLLPLAPAAAPAQMRASAAMPPCAIDGSVATAGGAPLERATVSARATAVPSDSARGRTAADGRFCLRLRGAGEYVLEVEKDGFFARSLLVRLASGTATVDVRLAREDTVRLAGLVAAAPRRTPPVPRRGVPPGGDLPGKAAVRAMLFPGAPGDIAASAGVSGHTVPTGAQDLSIDGGSPAGNRTTLDGAGFDARDVPAEGLAAAAVFAHPYDVSRGQFTGGEVAGRTMGGTNLWGGAARVSFEPPFLSPAQGPVGAWGARPTRELASGGGGGPLLPGRLFVYGAAQADLRASATPGLASDAAPLPGSGVPADSLARFFSILHRLGVDPGTASARREQRSGSALLRFDYVPSGTTSAMLRLDGRARESDGGGSSPLALGAAAREETTGGGAMLRVTHRVGAAENELTAHRSGSAQRIRSPYAGPAGQVWVGGTGDDGAASGASLSFGGEPVGFPPERRDALEVGDRATLALGMRHQLQFGGAYEREAVTRASYGDRLGTFTFASLAELEAGRPSRFTRVLGDARARVATRYAAAYAGDQVRLGTGARLIFGVRAERYAFGRAAGANAAVDSAFGLRTTPAASPWTLSPRVGFTVYRTTGAEEFGILGGTGIFRGAAPTRQLAALLAQGGGGGAAPRLVCVGSAVPAPRWAAYEDDPASIPTRCADGTHADGVPPGTTGFAGAYRPPAAWHSSLGLTWLHVPTATGLELRLGATRGWGLALASDRNLARTPRFRLTDEGGRPVFAAPDAIDPASGLVSPDGSRDDGRFGVVRGLAPWGRSTAETVTLAANRVGARGLVELYYTFTRSRDQATGLAGPSGGWATTAGDPRRAEWAPSDFEQRHVLQLSVDRRLARWATAAVVGRVVSGAPFTPLVDADVNGDGVANDRAFVFGPAAADTGLANGMAALLGRLPGATRACLLRQAGSVAARNGCRTPWNAFVDAQLNLYPGGPRNRRFAVNVVGENLTAGLDYLLHGGAGLRGWGQFPSFDPVLLRVVGFDRARERFVYRVNPGFGPDAGRAARTPFALRVQARITLGADPATQALVGQVVYHQSRLEPAALRRQTLARWRNVPAEVLAADADRPLGLSPAQLAALRAAADSVSAASEPLAAALAGDVTEMGAGTDGAKIDAALSRQRDGLDAAQSILARGWDAARAALTPAQWSRLPGRVRAAPRATLPATPPGGVQLLPDF